MSQAAYAQPSARADPGRDLSRLSIGLLPVTTASKAALMALGARATLSTTRVADIVLADPGLALQLLREANQQAVARHELEVAGVSHAVLLLGMEQTLDFVAHLRTVESIRPRMRREGLLHAAARAAHAGALARDWVKPRGESVAETAACAALARHAAELALWAGDLEAVTLFARLHCADRERVHLERELLGCTLRQLGTRLVAEARFPVSVGNALDDVAALQPRATPSVLASAIADAAALDWHAERTVELITLSGELHGLDPDRAAARIHSSTAAFARHSPFGIAFSAARYLLLPPGERFEPEELAPPAPQPAPAGPAPAAVPDTTTAARRPPPPVEPAPTPPATATASAPDTTIAARRPPPPTEPAPAASKNAGPLPTHPVAATPSGPSVPASTSPATRPAHQSTDTAGPSAEEIYQDCVRRLTEVRRGHITIQKVLPTVIDGIREGLGFDRAVFALRHREQPLLQARYTSGGPREPSLEVDLSRANLMTRLMESPQGIWLHESTRERLWPYLPRNVRSFVGQRNFCAMSLFVRDRGIGLLFADYEGQQIDEKAFHRFKRVASELAAALAPRGTRPA